MIIKNKGKEPAIYIRYNKEKILYIGETEDYRKGRTFREEIRVGDWDKVRTVKASRVVKRRKYWEAYLICKLKPVNMDTTLYFKLVKKQKEISEDIGATLGPGPKAGPKGVKDNYYVKAFGYKLVDRKKQAKNSKAIDYKDLWGKTYD